jgi:hypothetical protein
MFSQVSWLLLVAGFAIANSDTSGESDNAGKSENVFLIYSFTLFKN